MKAYLIVALAVHDEAMLQSIESKSGTRPNRLEVSFSLLVVGDRPRRSVGASRHRDR